MSEVERGMERQGEGETGEVGGKQVKGQETAPDVGTEEVETKVSVF